MPMQELNTFEGIRESKSLWNVPTTFTSLVGREQDVLTVSDLLCRPEMRLLTLLGTGGIGKTRLSFQVAVELRDYFADGICLVALAPVMEVERVLGTIAEALGIQEMAGQSLLEQVTYALCDKQMLLVLDNFEQVIDAAPLLEDLLSACPFLKLLVTSREVLHLQAEHQFPVTPLALPSIQHLPECNELLHYAAITLFVQRAQAVQPGFRLTSANAQAIAEVCTHLDGLPLAIELAAAHVKLLTPQALLDRLTSMFQVLTSVVRTLPERHKTLRNAMQWSYDLLDEREKWLFRRLSVFVGGWTLQAVEALCAEQPDIVVLERMASLLDKSLLLQVAREG